MNIVCLEPCQRWEDSLQLHDELLEKGVLNNEFIKIHDEIGVPGCREDANKTGQCKLAFRDSFSRDLVKSLEPKIGK